MTRWKEEMNGGMQHMKGYEGIWKDMKGYEGIRKDMKAQWMNKKVKWWDDE
jgi:hypothetical protein